MLRNKAFFLSFLLLKDIMKMVPKCFPFPFKFDVFLFSSFLLSFDNNFNNFEAWDESYNCLESVRWDVETIILRTSSKLLEVDLKDFNSKKMFSFATTMLEMNSEINLAWRLTMTILKLSQKNSFHFNKRTFFFLSSRTKDSASFKQRRKKNQLKIYLATFKLCINWD